MKLRQLKEIYILFLGITLSACATSSVPTRNHLVLEPVKIIASTSGDGSVEVLDADELFARGNKALDARRYEDAKSDYKKLLRHFPESEFATLTQYNLGLAHEGLKEFADAIARYEQFASKKPQKEHLKDASFRMGACYAELGEWKKSAAIFARILEENDLSLSDRIEAIARKGLAHFRDRDLARADETLRYVLRFNTYIQEVERLDGDFYLAMAHFYLGAIAHTSCRNVSLPDDKTLATQLDEKARLLLDAQANYIAAIKVKHAYWASVAGFQIGALYKEFYDALMRARPSFDLAAQENSKQARVTVSDAKRQLEEVYFEELHVKVKPLLHKALRVFEKNALVAQSLGVDNGWVKRSWAQIEKLKRMLIATPSEIRTMMSPHVVYPEDEALEPDPQFAPESNPVEKAVPTRETSSIDRRVM